MFKEMFFAASCGIAAAALAAEAPTDFSCRHGKFTIVGKTNAAGARAEVYRPPGSQIFG